MQNYIETSIFNENGDSLPGPLIIGTFDSRNRPQEDVTKTGNGERGAGNGSLGTSSQR